MAEEKSESASFTIEYFGMGGRAAPLRAAAFMGGVSYKDRFVTGPEHGKIKGMGLRRWSGIPEVTLHDKDGNDVAKIGQSNCCLKLIGQMAGFYPENVVLRALVDEILAATEDVMGMLAPSFPVKDAEKKKAMRLELMKEDKFPYWFQKFENRFTENEARGSKSGYIVGDTMTVADLKLYYSISFLTSGRVDHIDGDVLLKAVPKVTAFTAKMKDDENIKKFEAAFAKQCEEMKARMEADAKDNEYFVKGKAVYAEM